MREALEELLPEARIDRPRPDAERELERVMRDFTTQRQPAAVTIIETGIDIPTANTIIINRADRFGLAQLHQLRGRVGARTTRPTPTCWCRRPRQTHRPGQSAWRPSR
jgi:transcription-repair coupling factor (superfamily II helicase)